jgi:hypothetical protein
LNEVTDETFDPMTLLALIRCCIIIIFFFSTIAELCYSIFGLGQRKRATRGDLEPALEEQSALVPIVCSIEEPQLPNMIFIFPVFVGFGGQNRCMPLPWSSSSTDGPRRRTKSLVYSGDRFRFCWSISVAVVSAASFDPLGYYLCVRLDWRLVSQHRPGLKTRANLICSSSMHPGGKMTKPSRWLE